MKPAVFDYHRARNTTEALTVLRDRGADGAVLAGGQSLVPLLTQRAARPGFVLDINGLAELATVDNGDGLRIGALTRHHDLMTLSDRPEAALLARAAAHIAHPAVRNRGTIGGSIAFAHPAAEIPAALLALDAQIELRSASTTRTVPAIEFFLGAHRTALRADELITSVYVPPRPTDWRWAVQEIARRRGDYALALVIVGIAYDQDRVCREARVVAGGVADTPSRVRSAEEHLVGRNLVDPAVIARAGALVTQNVAGHADMHAPEKYRRRVAGTLTRRALTACLEQESHVD